ncbi:hypothetical protein XA68_14346 [Ophiocordyceps unilateralis]|uniref:Uncharacterized protein n=1 Tax=Ophiocordyceps unilateralis TaxID=268505 RepID=A0A2A9PAK6_OPHUN|nr:hypothetical protein XA68_14346 [Ophiocordyceps unilateralis]
MTGPGNAQQPHDPVDGPFFGGVPTASEDGAVTFLFLLVFALAAFLNIRIFQKNRKRHHKFLLSMPFIVFCLTRVLLCFFRFTWSFLKPPFPRAIVFLNSLFDAAGLPLVFPANLIFAQRIIRAMHPIFGWHPILNIVTLSLAASVLILLIISTIAIFILFFAAPSTINQSAILTMLNFFGAWKLMLCLVPPIWIFIACAMPGPPPQNFGTGHLRLKTTLVVFSTVTLAVGQAVRLAASDNPKAAFTGSPLFGKPMFYTIGFFLETLTIFGYIIFRFDNLFYVPDGARGPGDYALNHTKDADEPSDAAWTRARIEQAIGQLGFHYEFLIRREQDDTSPLYALLYPSSKESFKSSSPAAPSAVQPPPKNIERSVERLSGKPKSMNEWARGSASSWDSVDEAKTMFI